MFWLRKRFSCLLMLSENNRNAIRMFSPQVPHMLFLSFFIIFILIFFGFGSLQLFFRHIFNIVWFKIIEEYYINHFYRYETARSENGWGRTLPFCSYLWWKCLFSWVRGPCSRSTIYSQLLSSDSQLLPSPRSVSHVNQYQSYAVCI